MTMYWIFREEDKNKHNRWTAETLQDSATTL